MKKITFLLLMVFMMSISFGNNYTTADKIKILKQFQEFQKSVEKENKSKILNYIAFPAEMNFKKITKKPTFFNILYTNHRKYIILII